MTLAYVTRKFIVVCFFILFLISSIHFSRFSSMNNIEPFHHILIASNNIWIDINNNMDSAEVILLLIPIRDSDNRRKVDGRMKSELSDFQRWTLLFLDSSSPISMWLEFGAYKRRRQTQKSRKWGTHIRVILKWMARMLSVFMTFW